MQTTVIPIIEQKSLLEFHSTPLSKWEGRLLRVLHKPRCRRTSFAATWMGCNHTALNLYMCSSFRRIGCSVPRAKNLADMFINQNWREGNFGSTGPSGKEMKFSILAPNMDSNLVVRAALLSNCRVRIGKDLCCCKVPV